MSDEPLWQFWIDVGGTFTDCIARRPDGSLVRQKVLSSGVTKGVVGEGSTTSLIFDAALVADMKDFWRGYLFRLIDARGIVHESNVVHFDSSAGAFSLDPPLEVSPPFGTHYELASGEEAPIVAIRKLLGLRLDEPIPACTVRLGTTRGTNALLTRTGARTTLVTTEGFGDVLRIGYQNRPHLFELAIQKPTPLYAESIEIAERTSHNANVLKVPDEAAVRKQLVSLKQIGIEALAVCLLHGATRPDHEQLVRRIAEDIGFDEVSISSDVAQLLKIVARGDTTVVDAYLNPVLRDYVAALRESLGESPLRLMTSAGGLVDAGRFTGKDSILSGPAGGVVGLARVAEAAGFERALGFDMGGTSTDVSRFDGEFLLQYEAEKAGVRIVTPMMAIETVAAGGGSVCHFDGVKLAVGPASAGADPGPACYGRGGPLAVTDINFLLGKILPDRFPFPLSMDAVQQRLEAVRDEVAEKTGKRFELVELANGFLRIANAKMASAIRSISVAEGCDPREYVLVAFGAAAGQHACAVARELSITQILNHPDAGLLSAYGIGLADITRHGSRAIGLPLGELNEDQRNTLFLELEQETRRDVAAEGVADDRIRTRRSMDLRYQGLDAYLTIAEPSDGDWQHAYVDEHRKRYGYVHEGRPIEVVTLRVEAIGSSETKPPPTERAPRNARQSDETTTVYFDAAPHEAGVFARDDLRAGDVVAGPAIICEPFATTVIDPGWEAETLSGGELILHDAGNSLQEAADRHEISDKADPTLLEVFNNHFAEIAEQMGITLRNTSSSVNVKERLDFSCAIFTPDGDLVVNAPHIPVHLGAMGETVRSVLIDNPDLVAGDVIVTNNPYRGGSHLPDVTVVSPVHDAASGQLLFVTASRAHHAEIGGTVPGSMPPFSKNLAEEGVLLANIKLIDGGHSRMDELA
ncbi:MAG: hydantoinase B/oxoprolinase family protein, partial [Pirellulales bacterium]|nr:hydantoinase B/oxoprolinase family protein [Pirellulales bacterium]